jgi:serine/threonine protein kinase
MPAVQSALIPAAASACVKLKVSKPYFLNIKTSVLLLQAPELLLHGRASKASDVYAFGILLWELTTGLRAFQGEQSGQAAPGFEPQNSKRGFSRQSQFRTALNPEPLPLRRHCCVAALR